MLMVVWVAVGVFVVANWWSRFADLERLELGSKPLATIAIGVLAVYVSDGAPGLARGAAVVGFTACLAGDVALLARVDRFIVGLGSFLVGHLAFMVMFLSLGLDRAVLGLAALVLILALTSRVGRRIVRGARAESSRLAGPVMAYLGVIGVMMIAGWATGRVAACVGTTLFVLSDSVLGWRKFVAERAWMSPAVMIAYHGALIGIALSLA